jgi:preprotein translocase subunit YajC
MKSNFKIGDKVIINSWYYAKIHTPQNGIIVKVYQDGCRITIEKDHYGDVRTWGFLNGEFELSQKKQLES